MSAATNETTRGRVFSTRVVQADWRSEASIFIRSKYGQLRGAHKVLARLAGASPRTVERWFQAGTCPTEDNLFNLMLADKQFRRQMLKFTNDVIAYRQKNGIE